VESNARLGPNVHGAGDGEEILAIENIALEDAAVKAEVAKLQLPEGTVVCCDPWIYGMVKSSVLYLSSSNTLARCRRC
jgi:primary-amine oxidase